MKNSVLNITNGDAFNVYFLSKFSGIAVPFREAMMDGDAVSSIFSDDFIHLRSKELEVTFEEYRGNMLFCDELNKNDYSGLCLWFGKDTFCQINLLTLLAYLEQIEYQGDVMLNYIDDETFDIVQSNIGVELGIYKKLYEEILILKKKPSEVGVLSPRAIELYFDYISDENLLAKTVRENFDRTDMEIILILLENSKEYGLSDIQAKKIIERNKRYD